MNASDILFRLNLRSHGCGRENEPDTRSSSEQTITQSHIYDVYANQANLYADDCSALSRTDHLVFLNKMLHHLPASYMSYDSSKPWLLYWTLHSLRMLGQPISSDSIEGVIHLMKSVQSPQGGFSGGPGQMSHLANTYAAVNALCECECDSALAVIDRSKMYDWIASLHRSDGSFCLQKGGEYDVRGAYCAIAVSKMCNIFTDELVQNTAQWIANCQTYEGGFGGVPGLEAHGGYTFCAVAALSILQRLDLIDLPRLMRWTVMRQMDLEGGFQGRTNKLVDSCYSFWVGGVFAILQPIIAMNINSTLESLLMDDWLYNAEALQDYLLICCQRRHPVVEESSEENDKPVEQTTGGMVDKPGKLVDLYHTCYALSGISLAQHPPSLLLFENQCDELLPVETLFNVTKSARDYANVYFSSSLPHACDQFGK